MCLIRILFSFIWRMWVSETVTGVGRRQSNLFENFKCYFIEYSTFIKYCIVKFIWSTYFTSIYKHWQRVIKLVSLYILFCLSTPIQRMYYYIHLYWSQIMFWLHISLKFASFFPPQKTMPLFFLDLPRGKPSPDTRLSWFMA